MSYYSDQLSGRRLQHCYEVASPRVKQYLEAEIQHAQEQIQPTDTVLELGCGYGRITERLGEVARAVVGIDSAPASVALADRLRPDGSCCRYLVMDAVTLGFPDGQFDAVLCLQNGLCAFHVDQEVLVRESLRVVRDGGIVLFSSYADEFWPHRLAWFRAQAAAGLLGEVDERASGDGVIVCKDGFRSGRLRPEDFRSLCRRVGAAPSITVVDRSSVFCRIVKKGAATATGSPGSPGT